MTPIDEVSMLSIVSKLEDEGRATGHSRIPVHQEVEVLAFGVTEARYSWIRCCRLAQLG